MVLSSGQDVVSHFEQILKQRQQVEIEPGIHMPVTLLLLDINMPGMSGLEITRLIKPMFEAANTNYFDSVEGPNQ